MGEFIKMKNNPICLELEDFIVRNNRFYANVKVLSGEVESDSLLISNYSGQRFRIISIGFVPAGEFIKGNLSIVLELENGELKDLKRILKKGEILKGVDL